MTYGWCTDVGWRLLGLLCSILVLHQEASSCSPSIGSLHTPSSWDHLSVRSIHIHVVIIIITIIITIIIIIIILIIIAIIIIITCIHNTQRIVTASYYSRLIIHEDKQLHHPQNPKTPKLRVVNLQIKWLTLCLLEELQHAIHLTGLPRAVLILWVCPQCSPWKTL